MTEIFRGGLNEGTEIFIIFEINIFEEIYLKDICLLEAEKKLLGCDINL